MINEEQYWDTANELIKVMAQDRPLVLHLEDLHWADQPTLNLFAYLSRNTRGERVLIIGTYRPEELIESSAGRPHLFSLTLERMEREGLYEEISLGRLDKEGTEHVINAVFQNAVFPEGFAQSIYEETEGNPLFILEVLKLLRDEGVIDREDGGWRMSGTMGQVAIPGRVSDVIMNRLRRLKRVERNIVDIAAVEGRAFQSDTICHCLRLSRVKALRTLQDLEHFHFLIHAAEREYHFDHSMIREVVYANLIPELRKEYHRLIGTYLTEKFGAKEEYAGKIAHHLLNAGEEKKALLFLIKAGEHARSVFANDESIEHFDRGIELVAQRLEQHPASDLRRSKISLLKGRAEVKKLIGLYDDARGGYEEIERLARELGDQKDRAYGLNGVGEICSRQGDYETALSCYEEALRIRRHSEDEEGEGETLYNIGVVYDARGDHETALRYFEEALRIGRHIGDKQGEGNTLFNIGGIHAKQSEYEMALNFFGQSLAIRRQIADKRGEGRTLNGIGNVHYSRGEYEMALSYYEQALRIEEQIGDKRSEGFTRHNMGRVYHERGNYEMALSHFEQALKIWREIGNKRAEGDTLSNIGNAHYSRGEYEMALSHYELALSIFVDIGDKRGQWVLQHFLYKFWFDVGDLTNVLKRLEDAGRLAEIIGSRRMGGWNKIDSGLAKFVRGSYEDALLDIQKGLEITRETREVEAILEGLGVAANVEMVRGNLGRAKEYAEETLNLALEMGRKPDVARAHLLRSRIHLSRGELGDAERHASQAQKIAESTGMKGLLWTAHHYLGKVFTMKGRHSRARAELRKAEQVVREISSKLGESLRKMYGEKTELKELYEDLRAMEKSGSHSSSRCGLWNVPREELAIDFGLERGTLR